MEHETLYYPTFEPVSSDEDESVLFAPPSPSDRCRFQLLGQSDIILGLSF